MQKNLLSRLVDFGRESWDRMSYLDLAASNTGTFSIQVAADRFRRFASDNIDQDRFIVSTNIVVEGLNGQSIRSLQTICDLIRTGIGPDLLPKLVEEEHKLGVWLILLLNNPALTLTVALKRHQDHHLPSDVVEEILSADARREAAKAAAPESATNLRDNEDDDYFSADADLTLEQLEELDDFEASLSLEDSAEAPVAGAAVNR